MPVSVDFEDGYATKPAARAAHIIRVIDAGGIGNNFEDQIIGSTGLHPVADQVQRLKAIRQPADAAGVPLLINARTDLFLKIQTNQAALVAEALSRPSVYAQVGANGSFIPGLGDAALVTQICQAWTLPVNGMMLGNLTALPTAARPGAPAPAMAPVPAA